MEIIPIKLKTSWFQQYFVRKVIFKLVFSPFGSFRIRHFYLEKKIFFTQIFLERYFFDDDMMILLGSTQKVLRKSCADRRGKSVYNFLLF